MKLETLPKGVRLAVEAAQDKKAGGITVLDLNGVGAFTRYFVICTGYSRPQLQAICTAVEEVLYKELQAFTGASRRPALLRVGALGFWKLHRSRLRGASTSLLRSGKTVAVGAGASHSRRTGDGTKRAFEASGLKPGQKVAGRLRWRLEKPIGYCKRAIALDLQGSGIATSL